MTIFAGEAAFRIWKDRVRIPPFSKSSNKGWWEKNWDRYSQSDM